MATLKGLRFLDRYYAAHPRINAILFSTINVFSIPAQAKDLKQRDLTHIAKFVRNVTFYGPMFDWTLDYAGYKTYIDWANVRSKPDQRRESLLAEYHVFKDHGDTIRRKFESGGFFNAWVRILSSFRSSPRIEMHSFRTYAEEHHQEYVRYLVSRFYPDANVPVHVEFSHDCRDVSSIDRETRIDRLCFLTVQRAMHSACTLATEIVLDGRLSNETLIQYLSTFTCRYKYCD